MELQVIHHGGAVLCNGAVVRLKDLLPLPLLLRGQLRIRTAQVLAGGQLAVSLTDGSRHHVPLPEPGLPNLPAAEASSPVDLLVTRIGQLLTMDGDGLGLIQDAFVACVGDRVAACGPMHELKARCPVTPRTRILDAQGGVVTPGLVDPHTHPVFAGERSTEFGLKAQGASYLEIHKAGGGIFSTVRATREATFDELTSSCARNLSRLMAWGVTTCEGKTGYDLTMSGELRLLHVMQTVADCHPLDLVPTLLAAHALPPEFRDNRAAYIAAIVEELLPTVADLGLARFCDAYCEDGAFTPSEVEALFEAARGHGLGLRLHAEQFTDQGGAALAARLGAASADHLEAISAGGIDALASSSTVAVLLPGAALSCRCPWPPARELLDAGVHVALGTDLNPGSSMTSSLPLMMSLSCMQMKVTVEEAWRAVTVESARSLGLDRVGRLLPGFQADLALFDAPDYRTIPYHYGDNHLAHLVKRGQVVL